MSRWCTLMRGLCNKVSDPLKVRHTLDCIAAHITIWTYIHIFTYLCIIQEENSWHVNYKMQNKTFQSSAKVMYGKIKKQVWYIYIYAFSRSICSNSSFKNRFQESFLVKVIDTKKMHYMDLTLLIQGKW